MTAAGEAQPGARTLLAGREFRNAYAANAVSQLGNAFQFVALMWFAIDAAGPAGVIGVRLADSLPALLFGLHGGVTADRRDRRRTMIATDLIRAATLAPLAVAAVTNHLPLWGLLVAAFALTTASSYFNPALASVVPALVGRPNVQAASGLMNATNGVLAVVGWAVAAGLLALLPMGAFFALNAASFVVSAVLLGRLRPRALPLGDAPPQLRAGFRALDVRPGLAVAIAMFAAGMVVMTGVWTIGIAELAHSRLGLGAAGLSLLLFATAAGTIAASAALARVRLTRTVFTSCLVWLLLLPGYLLLAPGWLPGALLGTFFVGAATGAAFVLLTTAVQESMPDDILGRVMGIALLAGHGAKPVGLVAIAPLYAVLDPSTMFVTGGIVVFVLALAASAAVYAETQRALALA